MRDGERAPAAVLLGLMVVAIAVGILLTPESAAPRCDQLDPGSPPAFRFAPSYVPDGFALGGLYRHRGVELWFPRVDPAGPKMPSTWFSVYGSTPDSGLWQDRFGDDVEAGTDADHATRYDDQPLSELDVLLRREGSAWAAVEYVGLPESEARAIATSVQPLTPHDWEEYRRSSATYEELVMCDVVNGDMWFRSATMSEANDGRVATEERFGIEGTTGGLEVQLPTSNGLPLATDGDLARFSDFDLEQVDGRLRMLVATESPIEVATVHVDDGVHEPVVEEALTGTLPSRWCGPDRHCSYLIIDGATDWIAVDARVSDRSELIVTISASPGT